MTKRIGADDTDRALIIFIKNPVYGQVKTRIAKDAGEQAALDIYKRLLAHTRDVALNVESKRYLFYHNEIWTDDGWSSDAFIKRLQSGGDLGQKMQNAFEYCLRAHGKVIIIGSDCAQLSPEIIEEAFTILDEKDIALGPTFDGGYYLLGMKVLSVELFEKMTWSVSNVFAETEKRIMLKGLTFSRTKKLSDIDTLHDWEVYSEGL